MDALLEREPRMTEPLTHPIDATVKSGEEILFSRYARTRDPQLRDRLVTSHERLVRYLAGKFATRGEPIEDLVQVATIGLINAIDRYDPERGLKFTTYATPTIVGELRRYFRDKAWKLKVPRRLQELNQTVVKAREAFVRTNGRAPTVQEVAKSIGVTEEETLEAMELSKAYDTVSLDANVAEGNDTPLAECIGADDPALRSMVNYADLDQAISKLDARERSIVVCYYLHDMSQNEIAKRLNISQMHVSRLQKGAMKRLKKFMEESVDLP